MRKQYENFEWVDFTNPSQKELQKISGECNLDLFLINDSLQHGHLPKYEKVNDYHFLILRGYTADKDARIKDVSELTNKLAFFYSDKRLITIHRLPFEFMDKTGRTFQNVEQLVLELVQKLMTTFEPPIAHISETTDEFESKLFLDKSASISLEDLYYHKSHIRMTRSVITLNQAALNQMDLEFSENAARLQDAKDTLIACSLKLNENMDDAQNLLNTYLSFSAQKNNDVMKMLTVFSAFFLPLTFIVGVYGMNFDNMPELRHPMGYFAVLVMMVLISLGIFGWFKSKKVL
jgi:magnesium transporter